MKKTLTLIVVTICLVVGASIANAYSLLGIQWYNVPMGAPKALTYTWGYNITNYMYKDPYAKCKTAWQTACTDWNSSQTRINYSYSSSSNNTLDTYYLSSSSEYGVNYITSSGSEILYFTAQLNTGNSNLSSSSTVARSTANHELGHSMGLDDLSSGTAVMNTSRNRTSIYVPKTDDINGINAIYP